MYAITYTNKWINNRDQTSRVNTQSESLNAHLYLCLRLLHPEQMQTIPLSIFILLVPHHYIITRTTILDSVTSYWTRWLIGTPAEETLLADQNIVCQWIWLGHTGIKIQVSDAHSICTHHAPCDSVSSPHVRVHADVEEWCCTGLT